MKTPTKKPPRISKKQKILIVATGVVVVLFGWWAWGNFSPKPLGDRLEYLGKRDYGCWFCDSKPYSRYYYGTDVDKEELKTFFHNVHFETSYNVLTTPEYRAEDMAFTIKNDDLIITFYDNKQATIKSAHLYSSNRKNLISITNSDYELLKSALVK